MITPSYRPKGQMGGVTPTVASPTGHKKLNLTPAKELYFQVQKLCHNNNGNRGVVETPSLVL